MKRIVISILLVAIISDTKISYSMDDGSDGTPATVSAVKDKAGTPGDGMPPAVQEGSEGGRRSKTRETFYYDKWKTKNGDTQPQTPIASEVPQATTAQPELSTTETSDLDANGQRILQRLKSANGLFTRIYDHVASKFTDTRYEDRQQARISYIMDHQFTRDTLLKEKQRIADRLNKALLKDKKIDTANRLLNWKFHQEIAFDSSKTQQINKEFAAQMEKIPNHGIDISNLTTVQKAMILYTAKKLASYSPIVKSLITIGNKAAAGTMNANEQMAAFKIALDAMLPQDDRNPNMSYADAIKFEITRRVHNI